jgi:hypothetical protein
MRTLLACLVLVVLSACQRTNVDNTGRACLGGVTAWDTGSEFTMEDGDEVPIVIVLSPCESGSVEYKKQSCVVETSNGDVSVSSTARRVAPRMQTNDCQFVSMDCGTISVSEGEGTLEYGGNSVEFTVPYTGPSVCVEAP